MNFMKRIFILLTIDSEFKGQIRQESNYLLTYLPYFLVHIFAIRMQLFDRIQYAKTNAVCHLLKRAGFKIIDNKIRYLQLDIPFFILAGG